AFYMLGAAAPIEAKPFLDVGTSLRGPSGSRKFRIRRGADLALHLIEELTLAHLAGTGFGVVLDDQRTRSRRPRRSRGLGRRRRCRTRRRRGFGWRRSSRGHHRV